MAGMEAGYAVGSGSVAYATQEPTANEQVVDVLGGAVGTLSAVRNRLNGMLFGAIPEDGGSFAMPVPTISGQAMDARTLAREIEGLIDTLQSRLGAQV